MMVTILLPNPLDNDVQPLAMQYRGGGFVFLFILLAFSTLAYSWRTVWGFGMVTSVIWLVAYLGIEFFGYEISGLSEAAEAAFPILGDDIFWVDPNAAMGFIRVQEIIAFLIVAAVLATTVRRFSRLMMGHAALERERANLARYFSPNVVEQLSHSDEPLKEVRTQNVAVLFVDIVGFTAYAANRPSAEVIEGTPSTGLSVTSATPVSKKSLPGVFSGFSPVSAHVLTASTPKAAMSSGYCCEVAPSAPSATA